MSKAIARTDGVGGLLISVVNSSVATGAWSVRGGSRHLGAATTLICIPRGLEDFPLFVSRTSREVLVAVFCVRLSYGGGRIGWVAV